MKTFFRLSALFSLFALVIGLSSAQNAQDQSPEAFLMTYINALNTHDYTSAYNYMDNRSDSYADFVAGYEHTLYIVPYFGFGGAAAGSTYITTILLGYQDDGSIETYYGYFQLHSGQLYSPIRNNGGWVLGSARFRLIADGDTLHNSKLSELLSAEWQESFPTPTAPNTQLPTISEMYTEQARSLLAYYDLVNSGEYTAAYGLWLVTAQGLSRSHALAYADFVAGYADTDYVSVYVGTGQNLTSSGTFAGYLPTVLVSQHSDGSFESYSGCYALGRFSTGSLGIINGSFSLLKDDATNSSEIFTALATLNCASLNMGL